MTIGATSLVPLTLIDTFGSVKVTPAGSSEFSLLVSRSTLVCTVGEPPPPELSLSGEPGTETFTVTVAGPRRNGRLTSLVFVLGAGAALLPEPVSLRAIDC